MKQLYRVLPIVLSIGLFGCNNSTTPQETVTTKEEVTTEGQDKFVSKLPDSAPTMKVAMTGDLPPFSYQDDFGNMQGTDVDSIRAIGEEQGFKVEFYKETWQGLFDSVASGNRDIAVSGIAYKEDRDAKYGLSIPYFFNPSAIMYENADLNIKGLNDLKGLRIGALEGSRQADLLKDMGSDIKLTTVGTSFLSYENLVQGKIDAIVDDMHILQYTARTHPESKVTIVPYEDADTPSAQQVVLMAKGNKELINNVNEGITKLIERGTFKDIEQRWLGEVEALPTATKSDATTTE